MTDARQRWVVKIGSSLLTDDGRGLHQAHMSAWAAQISALHKQGLQVVLVSSGAVAEGMVRLGWTKRPSNVSQLQAAAAVGQMGVIQAWESHLARQGLKTAQVLLTHEDVRERQRYLNARGTLLSLLQLGVVPVVNENDTVATDEIRLGDNDTLAALTASLVDANRVVLLTDQDGLFDADPRKAPNATLIPAGVAGDPALLELAGEGRGALGRGGMRTKLLAAQRAARAGAITTIANGREPKVLERLLQGDALGTTLAPADARLPARKRWIAGQGRVCGQLQLDEGAVRALRQAGRSLLPVGVVSITGNFKRGDLVSCLAPDGRECARGLANYAAQEARELCRHDTSHVRKLYGPLAEPELIHRDNLIVV